MGAVAGWPDGAVAIPDLLRAAPQARAVLDRYGLRGCGGRWGPSESLAFFAGAHDVPLDQLLAEVRAAVRAGGPVPAEEPDPDQRLADTIYRPLYPSRKGLPPPPWMSSLHR